MTNANRLCPVGTEDYYLGIYTFLQPTNCWEIELASFWQWLVLLIRIIIRTSKLY